METGRKPKKRERDLDVTEKKGEKEKRRNNDIDGLKEIRQESRKTDTGADRGNQMGWDQTAYCRGTGWQTQGAVSTCCGPT